MNVGVLSYEERAYLLGLFLADGNMTRVKHSARVIFSLASNEEALAERVFGMLGRLGFHPNIKVYSGDRNYIAARVYGVDLLSYFPDKKSLLSLDAEALENWFRCEGLWGELGIPFLAGLVDGDGYVSAKYDRRSIFPCVEVCWSFVQKELGFLIDFIIRYVERLTPHGVGVYVRKGGKGRIVNFSTSGREALLSRGMAKWSWKVSWCTTKTEKMRQQVADLRSRFYTTPQVACRLHVSRATVLWWCNHGSVSFMRIRGNRYGAGSRYYFIIPVEEVERLRKIAA
jgi:hypothetical protein